MLKKLFNLSLISSIALGTLASVSYATEYEELGPIVDSTVRLDLLEHPIQLGRANKFPQLGA